MLSEQEQIYKSSQLNSSKENEKSRSILSATKETYNMSVTQAKLNSKMLSSRDVMQLQRSIGNRATMQLLNNYINTSSVQKKEDENNISKVDNFSDQVKQKKENNTGLPDNLKYGVENISGMSMDDVRVNYNSDKPAQIGALAYAQGTDIHVAPGQEKHLAHEAWHVVQQAQGRVKPTMQMKDNVNVNDDISLEKEADVMGSKSINLYSQVENKENEVNSLVNGVYQKQKSGESGFQFADNEPKIRLTAQLRKGNSFIGKPIQLVNMLTMHGKRVGGGAKSAIDTGEEVDAVIESNNLGDLKDSADALRESIAIREAEGSLDPGHVERLEREQDWLSMLEEAIEPLQAEKSRKNKEKRDKKKPKISADGWTTV